MNFYSGNLNKIESIDCFLQGIMKLNISSLADRRGSDTRLPGLGGGGKKQPSPLDRTLTYLNPDDIDSTSDTESLARYIILTFFFYFDTIVLFIVSMLKILFWGILSTSFKRFDDIVES
jgi:hypothetical protein